MLGQHKTAKRLHYGKHHNPCSASAIAYTDLWQLVVSCVQAVPGCAWLDLSVYSSLL